MKKLSLYVFLVLMFCNFGFAQNYEVISKNPNKIKRGLLKKVYLTKLKNKDAYQIIKDPTGLSPIENIEMFSPKKGDCSTEKHWGGEVTDCNSGRQRLEISQGSKDGVRKSSIRKNPKEYWYGYYLFIPNNFPTNDKYCTPYINQFFAFNKGTKGGLAPFFSGALIGGRFMFDGNIIIERDKLKNNWHKIEIHIRFSIKDDGFIKVYHNNKLKLERKNFVTMPKDYLFVKYGIYNYKGSSVPYHLYADYSFPDQTIYFAGYSISKKKENLKINRNKE